MTSSTGPELITGEGATRVPITPGDSAPAADLADVRALGDITPDSLRLHLHRMAEWASEYRRTIEERPISPSVAPGSIAAQLRSTDWDEAAPLDVVLAEFERVAMPGILHWGHPSFLGYFGSTSNGPALIGEIAAAALNVSAMTWRTSPAATEMETVTLEWIRDLVGIPEEFFGVVYDTASVATLHALAAAREMVGTDIRRRGLLGREDLPTLRIYASDQAHSSVRKAAIVLGLGEDNVVSIRADAEYKMDVGSLRAAMDADVAQGRRPLAVVATVGTTSTGSVDPVAEISELCASRGVWLHVDAAYGGALGALEEGRWAMTGTSRADSIVINPHKWLFVPLDFSALYTRHPDVLRSVFSLVPEYLRGDAASSDQPDYMDYGIQLGRRFRALKAWMVLRSFGRAGIVARLREHLRLARLFASWVDDDASFARAAPVTMGIVCFRFRATSLRPEDEDAVNEEIVENVNRGGRAYLTHTRLGGRLVMRMGLGNILTTEDHLAGAWELIRAESRRQPALGALAPEPTKRPYR